MSQNPVFTPPPGVDYSRKWWVMLAVAMGIFLGTIDGSIVNVALPTLVDEFDTSFAAVQWVVLGYSARSCHPHPSRSAGSATWSARKRIYTLGFGVFTVFSVLAGLAPSIEWLIGARVFQAVGAAMLFSLGLAIVTEAFPPDERGRALGITGSIVSIGIVIGPSVGGLLIDSLSWRWIFFVNLPVGIIGTLTAMRFVPNVPPPGNQRFDFLGGATFFVALLSFMLALTVGQERGFADGAVSGAVRARCGGTRRLHRSRAPRRPANARPDPLPEPTPQREPRHRLDHVHRDRRPC